jgi:exodeoxyribonuclease VIII
MNQPAVSFDIDEPKFPGIGLHDGISNKDYHSSWGISSSAVKKFNPANPTPRLYQAYWDGEIEYSSTSSMMIGTAYHKLMLEPDDFDREIKILDGSRMTKVNKELIKYSPELTFLTMDEYDKVAAMRDVAMEHPEVRDLLSMGGEPERSGWYQDLDKRTGEGTLQLCKYRPDLRYCPDDEHNTWLLDLKTTTDASPAGFARTMQQYGYHISASHYLEGERELFGRRPKQFIFVVQETSAPYLIAVYVLDEKAISHGKKLRRRALEGIHKCKRTEFWPHFHYNKAVMIDLPNYVYAQEDFV